MPMGTPCAPLINYWVTKSVMNVWLAKYEQNNDVKQTLNQTR